MTFRKSSVGTSKNENKKSVNLGTPYFPEKILSYEKMIQRTMKKTVSFRDHGDAVDVVEGTAMF